MNKRRKAYLRQLVAEKKKVPGLSEDDVRYIVSHINSQMRNFQNNIRVMQSEIRGINGEVPTGGSVSLITIDESKEWREIRSKEYEKNKLLGLPDPMDVLDGVNQILVNENNHE